MIPIQRSTWLQFIFWGSFWILIPFLLGAGWENPERYYGRSLLTFMGVAVVVFVNLEVLLPRFYLQDKKVLYAVAGTVLVILVTVIIYWDGSPWESLLRPTRDAAREIARNRPPRMDNPAFQGLRWMGRVMPYFTVFIGSALYRIASFADQKMKEAVQLQNEKLATELKFLKSQINPHFLFNSLNNIYTLTILKSDAAGENLLRLSEMLRYMIYDCNEETVPLKKEIAYIRNYTDLKMLKDSQGMNVAIDLDESRPELKVAPMLFIPFIENAFKHSKIEDLDKGWIKIVLKTGEKNIDFTVTNSVPGGSQPKDKIGGIGLDNVKRQLELLYPGKHHLDIHGEGDQFTAHLKIQLP